LFGIFSLDAINSNLFEELETDIEIEYSRDADGTKETNENRLPLLLNLVNELATPESVLPFRAACDKLRLTA